MTEQANEKPVPSEDEPQYRIETVQDFLKVPEDRLPTCLEEFADFLEVIRAIDTMAGLVGAKEGGVNYGAFTWVDDGKRGCRNINIGVHDED